jgi:hypothetical protein
MTYATRIKVLEKKLNFKEKPLVVQIIYYGDRESFNSLYRDREDICGNIITRHDFYEDLEEEKQGKNIVNIHKSFGRKMLIV